MDQVSAGYLVETEKKKTSQSMRPGDPDPISPQQFFMVYSNTFSYVFLPVNVCLYVRAREGERGKGRTDRERREGEQRGSGKERKRMREKE